MTTEQELERHEFAVEKLTRPWTDVLSPKETGTGKYQPVDYPPLLDMLREAIGSSLGKTQAGRSADAERSIMNLQAFTLWEHIDGTVRAWLRDLTKNRAESELKAAVTQLAGLLQALHASQQIKESQYRHITGMFVRWRYQIWELFDPPVVKELIGNCPNCDETSFVNAEGGKMTALIAYYWKGIRPEAKCQRCGEHWTGEAQLLSLGRVLGAEVDEEALRELGVL